MEFSEEESKQIFKIFKEESEEHICNINRCLLELEKNPDDMELITELFREAHSIKGSARMLDVVSIQTLAHKIEDLIGFAKDGTLVMTPELVDIICKGIDVISKILEKIRYNTLDYVDEASNALCVEIECLKESVLSGEFNSVKNTQVKDNSDSGNNASKDENVDSNGNADNLIQPKKMLQESDKGAEISIATHYVLQLNNKYKRDNAIIELSTIITDKIEDNIPEQIKELFKLILKNLEYIKENNIVPSQEAVFAISESFASALSPKPDEDIMLVIQRQTILKQMLELSRENDKIFSIQRSTENTIDEKTQEVPQKKISASANYDVGIFKTLRVDTQKLDKLESQVEELIVFKIKNKQHLNSLSGILSELSDVQKIINKAISNCKYSEKKYSTSQIMQENLTYLKNALVYLEKLYEKTDRIFSYTDKFQKQFLNDDIRLNFLTEEFENTVKSIRILPLATIFHMFPRMVRDISREQNKQVDMIVSGSETTADKTIIEEIKSPLIHIIRNAIDHGIETPEERIKLGKNPTGKIILNSYHSGNYIIIEVTDDGRGIDPEKIKEKALKRNLMTVDELNQLSETQVMNLIFWPGFTTGDTVTEISGRGVGLDVVHTKTAQLDGKVSIKSENGAGFRITIKIPITHATIKALLVKQQNYVYAISSTFVKTALCVKDEDVISKEGKPQIIYNNTSIKLVKLSAILGIKDDVTDNSKHNIVIIQHEETVIALEVDSFLRTEEILQKKLNPPLTRVKNISGISSLSDGETCLVLNMNDIIKSAIVNKEFLPVTSTVNMQNQKINIPNILLIDDSYTTLTIGKNILKSAQYNVFTAANGEEGISILSCEHIDLIITDLEMPVMNGIEFVEKVRTSNKMIPIIVLTSMSSPSTRDECYKAGATDYIAKKDFSEKLMISKIKEHLHF